MARRIAISLPFALAYFALAAISVALTRFDGGVAFISLATPLLIATLSYGSSARRPEIIGLAFVGGVLATGLFGIGWTAGPLLSLVGIGEALIAVKLLGRGMDRRASFDSLSRVLHTLFALGIAPVASALIGPLVICSVTGAPLAGNVRTWLIAHVLGNIILTPFLRLAVSGEMINWARRHGRWTLVELSAVTLLVAGISVFAFSQSDVPLLFFPALVVIFATFRLGAMGAATALVVLAASSFTMTLMGHGPIDLIQWPLGWKLQFLQFYLAATVLCVLPIAGDLQKRSQLYRSLHQSEALYRALADNSTDIIMSVAPGGKILFASQSIRQLGGYEPEDVIGRSALELVDEHYVDHVREAHRATLAKRTGSTRMEYLGILKNGERHWFEATTRAVLDERGEPIGVVSVVRDIGERKALENQLVEAALTDPLTGIGNRRAFTESLQRFIDSGTGGCIAMFDIDHFKSVNDRYGHDIGDKVLEEFARLAKGLVRGTDLVARIGGEEFAILLPGQSMELGRAICQRILTTLAARPVQAGDLSVRVTASGGIAPIEGDSETCIKAADKALYAAKRGGRDQLRIAA